MAAYLNNKIRYANRLATARKRGGQMGRVTLDGDSDLPSLQQDNGGLDPDAFLSVVEQVASKLPQEDGSAEVFRKLLLEEYTQEQLAEERGDSVRTVERKAEAARNHIVDLFLTEAGLSDAEEEVVRLVLDPRTRLPVPPGMKEGPRVQLRIQLTAVKLEIPEEEVVKRLNRALRKFWEYLQ